MGRPPPGWRDPNRRNRGALWPRRSDGLPPGVGPGKNIPKLKEAVFLSFLSILHVPMALLLGVLARIFDVLPMIGIFLRGLAVSCTRPD